MAVVLKQQHRISQDTSGVPVYADKTKGRCCTGGASVWCRRYWWEGQELTKPSNKTLEERLDGKSWPARILIRHRRIIGFCVPAAFFHFFWWAYFINFNQWHLFLEKYPMSITMIFGSMIAGMTSEGGGAIAFPVMTLALNVDPSIARDFSMMIQSFGMSAASFTIFFMKIRVEWKSLIVCSIGAVGGVIFGLHIVDPSLSPKVKKLGFVSIWFAFASVLLFLNRVAKRRTFKSIQSFNWWKCFVLLAIGFLGGIFTSFAGNGLDICSFMVLTLLFRVNEKVATPTSVILMAFNSVVGFYWRAIQLNAISQDAWEYLGVCLPIVVIGAPAGSVLGTHFHRLVLAGLVIAIDTVALVSAFAIIRPTNAVVIGGCVSVIVGCTCIFLGLTYAGQKLLNKYETEKHLGTDEMNDETAELPTSTSDHDVSPDVPLENINTGFVEDKDISHRL